MSAGIGGRELSRSLVDLLGRTGDFERALGRLTRGFILAVSKNGNPDGSAMTAPQIRERFDRCMKIAEVLMGDMKWSAIKTADALPHLLKLDLAGTAWEPAARHAWFAP